MRYPWVMTMELFQEGQAVVAGPYRAPPPSEPELLPFDGHELRRALLRPHLMIELVLVERLRLTKTVAEGRELATLVAVLTCAVVVLALPFGAVVGSVWRVAAWLLGSLLVCFPSLHVTSSYLGCRMSVVQNLVMALVMTAVTSMFTLGFAPIVWFVGVSTPAGSTTAATVALVLLVAALVAGMIHLTRCIVGDAALRPSGSYRVLMTTWQALFGFVAYRMALFLELL